MTMPARSTRRSFTTGLLGLAALPTACGGPPKVEAWRDRTCGCCGGWVEHLRAEGFEVDDKVVDAVGP
ncbi:MAG: metal-binding protein, partial [Azospirillum brasilense]